MTSFDHRVVVVTWKAAFPYSTKNFCASAAACWDALVAAQVNVAADETNILLVEGRLGVDQALLASKSYCASYPVTVEAFDMVDHLACPLKRYGAYQGTEHSFVDAFPVQERLGGLEGLEDGESALEQLLVVVVVAPVPFHQKEPSSWLHYFRALRGNSS